MKLDPRVRELQERKSEVHSLMLRGSEALLAEQSHMAIKIYNQVLQMFETYTHQVSKAVSHWVKFRAKFEKTNI